MLLYDEIWIVYSCSAAHIDLQSEFQKWRVEHSKFYSNANEYQKRYAIWSSNYKRVLQHNSEDHTYEVGMNYFADLDNAEFRALYTMPKMPSAEHSGEPFYPHGYLIPESLDWRTLGMVNPVKDQGQCGSCYAFGAVAGMEAAYAKAGHSLVRMSEQNAIDCSWNYGNEGCNGGWHYSVFDYVIKNGGIDGEATYPYTAKSSYTCKYKAENSVGTIKSYYKVDENEDALLQAAAEGVVSIAIDAGNWSFQMYKSGVYNEPKCSPTDLDHAVALVGFGTQNGQDYWIVRNSWGTSWGNKGYILMSRGKNNQCGVATEAYLPVA